MAWGLKVEQPAKYGGRFPICHLPIEIGHFSLNSNGKFCDDKHQLKYLVMPNKTKGLRMDLNEGYSKYIYEKEESDFNYEMILRWIIVHREEIKKHFVDRFTSKVNIDFVCMRGFLKRICLTIYENQVGWAVIAGKYKSAIYLAETSLIDESDSESEGESKSESESYSESASNSESTYNSENARKNNDVELEKEKADRLRLLFTWGHKFEQYMTSDTINSKPDTSAPVNQNEKFYTVLKGKFGKHTLLYGGELDSVDPAYYLPGGDPTSVLRYVELKTTRIIECRRQHRNFLRYKLIEWYLQSFFVGTQRVVCGFRDDEGIVRELSTFNVRDMPMMAEGMWSKSACLNFGIRFLDFVKRTVVKDCSKANYLYYWEPGSHITCVEIPAKEEGFPVKWYRESDYSIP